MTPTQTLFSRLMRRAPILLIALAAVLAFVFFRHLVSLQGLEQHRHDLLALVEQHYVATSVGFIVIYTGLVVISIPGSAVVAMAACGSPPISASRPSGGRPPGVTTGLMAALAAASSPC